MALGNRLRLVVMYELKHKHNQLRIITFSSPLFNVNFATHKVAPSLLVNSNPLRGDMADLKFSLKYPVDYYNELRAHQSLNNLPLQGIWETVDDPPGSQEYVVFVQSIGGVLKHYKRLAA